MSEPGQPIEQGRPDEHGPISGHGRASGSGLDASLAGLGVVLLHEFAGTPASMQPLAEHLRGLGAQVRAPMLPGHGTRWEDLGRTRWEDWYARAEQEVLRLAERCGPVVVGGLSVGGALALRLAEQHPARVSGVLLVNPSLSTTNRLMFALPVVKRFVRSVANAGEAVRKPDHDLVRYPRIPLSAVSSLTGLWRDVRQRLDQVHQPVLVFRSAADGVAGEQSARIVLDGVGSTWRQELVLERSGHIATLDYDAAEIAARAALFVASLVHV